VEEQLLHNFAPAGAAVQPSWPDRLVRRAVLRRLDGLKQGRLTVVDWEGRYEFGRATPDCPLSVRLTIHDPAVYARVAFGGTIGAGEAYLHGEFDVDDLTTLVRLFVRNRDVMQGMEGGTALLRVPLHRLTHRLRRNSRPGSRRNISAHYDLGNAFFERFLDRNHMMYSSAVFPRPEATLEEAAEAKLDRICDKLELGPEDHVLDIGGGWGGFAIHAARTRGCRVTMTTISREQFALASRRVQEAGLSDRVTVLNQDYRDLSGQFDKLVSIEMIEAIGHEAYPAFFQACSRLLRPGGTLLLQAITIAEPFYEEARRNVDFIQRYIFPGGALPSVTALCEGAGAVDDLRVVHLEDLGLHYALTLGHWRRRLHEHWQTLRADGQSQAFLRMWEFYLSYCEGGFLERSIGLAQVLFTKPTADAGGPSLASWPVAQPQPQA